LIGASAESIQRSRFYLMMSKGKEGIAHAANQDVNRRLQHELAEASESHGGACEVVRGTWACLGVVVGEMNAVGETGFLMMHEDIEFGGWTFARMEANE